MQLPTLPVRAVLSLALMVCATGLAAAQSIYTCTDGKGRKITADRPISECIDRTQQELSPSGLVKRQLGPSLTAHERAELEEKDKQQAEIRARENEDKRRDRALLLRYPARAVHDKERAAALAQIDEVIKSSIKRRAELLEQRQGINSELEFYVKDPGKAPGALKRKLDDNDSSLAVQQRFVLDQEQEKKRVNQRFDEELVKLSQLWAPGNAPAPAAASRKSGTGAAAN